MSFSSQDTIGVSSTKPPTEVVTFISYVLPHMLCHFVMAVLAITPQTRTIRLALCPVILLLVLRAALAVPTDTSLKTSERRFHYTSALWMFGTTIRTLGWAMARKPLVRQLRPMNSTPSTLLDAFDLVSNIRGHGWDWSRGVYFPRETRPSNRTGFIFYTFLSAAANACAFSILNTAIRSFSPAGLRTLSYGPTIFDESFSLYLRFLRSSIISILGLVWAYVNVQAVYDLCTILGVLIIGQDPAQWPPVFDAPWRATSVSDFWGRRWHQLLRYILLVLGGYPLSFILGRVGIVIGAFLASAVHHHIGLAVLNSQSEFWRMLVGYGMMAVGIIIEGIFKHVTGRKVQGLAGWVWTMSWIVLWCNVIGDGYMRAGLFELPTPIDWVPPVRMLVERMVIGFDNFLHAISSAPVA